MDVLGEALDRLRGLRPADYAREQAVLRKQLAILAVLSGAAADQETSKSPPARPRKSRATAAGPAGEWPRQPRIVLPLGLGLRRRVVALVAAEGPLDVPHVAERLGLARYRASQLVWQAVGAGELACGPGYTFVAAEVATHASVRRRSRSEPGPPPRASSSGE